MSAKSELKARSAVRQKKRDLRGLRKGKRKRKNGLDDDDDDDDSGGEDAADAHRGFMPTPAQMRAAEQGATVMNNKRKKKKSKEERSGSGHGPGQTSISVNKLPKQDFSCLGSFQKSFWTGPPGEDPPSEALKSQRKALGVLCRGLLAGCPPPILDGITSTGLPPSFAEFFKYVSLKTPSVVQKQCWPAALAGLNILGIAPTGSGKTLAYTLPMIPHIQARVAAAAGGSSSSSGSSNSGRPLPKALVIVPTRELALQVVAAMKPLQKLFAIRAVAIYGGQEREKQIDQLSLGASSGAGLICVATPGRLLDLIAGRLVVLTDVTYLVIDEADRMLAMGFSDQLTAIASQMRPQRQTLLFSATFPGRLREAAAEWCGEACVIRCSTMEVGGNEEADASKDAVDKPEGKKAKVEHAVVMEEGQGGEDRRKKGQKMEVAEEEVVAEEEKEEVEEGRAEPQSQSQSQSHAHASVSSLTVSDTITQHVHVCVPHKRPRLLIKYILRVREKEKADKVRQLGSMLVFCTRIKTVGFVHGFLKSQDVVAEVLHGQLQQSQREKILMGFKAGKINCLICTDVAARGIHVKNLKYVVNYDFPNNLEQYCHRIGRTGRQGDGGHAYSFFTRNLAPMAPDLLTLLRNCKQEPEKNLLALAEQFTQGSFSFTDEDLEFAKTEGEEEEE